MICVLGTKRRGKYSINCCCSRFSQGRNFTLYDGIARSLSTGLQFIRRFSDSVFYVVLTPLREYVGSGAAQAGKYAYVVQDPRADVPSPSRRLRGPSVLLRTALVPGRLEFVWNPFGSRLADSHAETFW